jgi:hypothetical protein
MIALDPIALGGVIGSSAKSYEFTRCLKAKLHYEPTCSATTEGAIAMAMCDDPALQVFSGNKMLAQISTYPGFIQTSIWNEACCEGGFYLDDEEFYTRETPIDARETTPGLFVVVTASQGGSVQSAGNLYLEVEYEFIGQALNMELLPIAKSNISCAWVAYTPVAQEPIIFRSDKTANNLTTSISGYNNSSGVFYGIITLTTGTLPTFSRGGALEFNLHFAENEPYFVRIDVTTTGTPDVVYEARFFSSLESAKQSMPISDNEDIYHNELFYTSSTVVTGTMDFEGFWLPMQKALP